MGAPLLSRSSFTIDALISIHSSSNSLVPGAAPGPLPGGRRAAPPPPATPGPRRAPLLALPPPRLFLGEASPLGDGVGNARREQREGAARAVFARGREIGVLGVGVGARPRHDGNVELA